MKKRSKPAKTLYLILKTISLSSESRLASPGERVSLDHLEPAAIQKLIDDAVVRLDSARLDQPSSHSQGE